jgi:2-hydroxy-3-oxopropionate reductase
LIQRVGQIGLGDMGMNIAKRILKGGFALTVFDMRREPIDTLKKLGASEAPSCKEVARASDVVISIVRNEDQTEQVLRGPNGLLSGMSRGSTYIIMSTLTPAYCQKIAAECASMGVSYLDCAVSRNTGDMGDVFLSIMVGGNEAVLERCRPLVESIGKQIFHMGGPGMGEVGKLVNTSAANNNLWAARESLALGVKAGVSEEKLMQMLKVSAGGSRVLEKFDFYKGRWDRVVGGPTSNRYKDLKFALDLADSLGVEMPLTQESIKLVRGPSHE